MPTYDAKLNTFIQRLKPATRRHLEAITSRRSYPAGTHLLRGGQVCRLSYQLHSGIARKYHLRDGREYTTEFYFAGDLALAYSSYTFQEPSQEYIECLTEVTVETTDYQQFQEAKGRFPELVELDLLLTELYTASLEQSLFHMVSLTATERYQRLLRQTPHLLRDVKLVYVASYLGVSPETLSRIRAKVR